MENYKLRPYLKMDIKIIRFDDIEIKDYKFDQHKIPILINDIDINKIVVFNREVFKFFIGYKDTKN